MNRVKIKKPLTLNNSGGALNELQFLRLYNKKESKEKKEKVSERNFFSFSIFIF